MSSTGCVSERDWERILDFFQHMCLACGRTDSEVTLSIDHVNPVFYGGTDEPANLQPLCMPCNMEKKARRIDYRSKIERGFMASFQASGDDETRSLRRRDRLGMVSVKVKRERQAQALASRPQKSGAVVMSVLPNLDKLPDKLTVIRRYKRHTPDWREERREWYIAHGRPVPKRLSQ